MVLAKNPNEPEDLVWARQVAGAYAMKACLLFCLSPPLLYATKYFELFSAKEG